MQFNSIWPIDRTLSHATTPSRSKSGSDGNKELLHIPQSSSITGVSPSDCLVLYLGHLLRRSCPSTELQSVYSAARSSVVQQRMTTMLMNKNIICFFSFPFITQNIRMGRVKEREREREREREMTEMQKQRGEGVLFLWNLFAFLLRSAWVEIFPCLYNFLVTHSIFVVTSPAYMLHMDMIPFSMPPTQFTQHFCWSSTPASCLL